MNAAPANFDTEFVHLLTAIQMPLAMYVRSLLPGDAAAANVMQEVNARIWEKRHAFELGNNFRAWAFSIARYEVLNYRKRQGRDRPVVFSDGAGAVDDRRAGSTQRSIETNRGSPFET